MALAEIAPIITRFPTGIALLTSAVSSLPVNAPAPTVSCIIVNYNAGKRLSACIESILQNKIRLEILVIDNASTDSSIPELIRQYGTDSRLTITKNTQNTGFSAACNQGARLAEGDYLLFLNPDCVLEEAAISELTSVFDSEDRTGMAGPLLLNPDGTEQAGGRRRAPTPFNALIRFSPILKRIPGLRGKMAKMDFNQNVTPAPDQPSQTDAISGACMLLSREAFTGTGGFDEGYFMHCEDLDLCMRIRQEGYNILFTPMAKVTHYAGTCSTARPWFVEWHKHRGMVRYYRKFFKGRYAVFMKPVIFLAVWFRFGVKAGGSLLHKGRAQH